MAWIELHQSLPSHRKTRKLARLLGLKVPGGIPQAIGHLTMLWLWSVDNAIDGDLSGIEPEDISDAAGWMKNPEILVDALVSSGFLDSDMYIHDWDDYAGKLATKRESTKTGNRERQRRFREREKQPKSESVTDDERNGEDNALVTRYDDVTSRVTDNVTSRVTSRVTDDERNGATVPNRTLPYPTVPNHEEDTITRARKTAPRFVPPSVDAVAAYCQERQNSVDAQCFVDFYTSKNWMVGKNKMRDWKASVRTWERNSGGPRAQGAGEAGSGNIFADLAREMQEEADGS